MWLHIRGVGEWTNRVYAYFEKEQERLHSGQVAASVPGGCSTLLPVMSETPQRDFLAKNLDRISKSPIGKEQSPSEATDANEPNANGTTNGVTIAYNKNELDISAVHHPPLRPPRTGQSTMKLVNDNHASTSRPPKYDRQTSETSAHTTIRKIQASLQRTFSRKGSTSDGSFKGANNDGFVVDEERKMKGKTPLEKSLSMPDIEIRNKRRERVMA